MGMKKRMTTIETGASRKVNGPVLAGALVLVAVALLARAALLGVPALCDNTESRYGTIGMEMARSGDWITPRIWFRGFFQPFWGKPPMHFWATAASFRLFGQNEVAARLPGFLGGLGILLSVVLLARRFWGAGIGWIAGAVLSSTLLFWGLSGSCTTDITLASFLAVAMTAFALSAASSTVGGRRLWGLLFFVAMAGAVLSKGPVALVLAGLSLIVWLVITRRWREVLRLPWWMGVPLFLILTVPWFIAAEKATPGFLRYYLVNEHFLRYVSHDYGDLYGSGHQRPWGTIWPIMVVSFLPWVFYWFMPMKRFIFNAPARKAVLRDPWLVYVLAWGLAPAVFFTFARQILPTYLAPGLAGLSIATAVGLARRGFAPRLQAGWIALAVMVAAYLLGSGFISERNSAKVIVYAVGSRIELAGRPVSFPLGEPHSGDFYMRKYLGRDMVHDTAVPGEGVVWARVAASSREILVMPRRKLANFPPALTSRLEVVVGTPSWVGCTVKGVR